MPEVRGRPAPMWARLMTVQENAREANRLTQRGGEPAERRARQLVIEIVQEAAQVLRALDLPNAA